VQYQDLNRDFDDIAHIPLILLDLLAFFLSTLVLDVSFEERHYHPPAISVLIDMHFFFIKSKIIK